MNKEKLFSFATSGLAAIALAMVSLISMKSLFEMLSFTSGGAWLLGTAVALVPAFFINRILTRAYVETCDVKDANEFSSFTGTLATVSLAIICGLWLGFAGTMGNEALSSGIREAGSAVGLLESPTVKYSKIYGEAGEKEAGNFLQSTMDSMKGLVEGPSSAMSNPVDSQNPPRANSSQQRLNTPYNKTLPETIKNSGSGNVTIFY